MAAYKIGDIVALVSGGPPMSVIEVLNEHEANPTYECSFFSRGEYIESTLPHDALARVMYGAAIEAEVEPIPMRIHCPDCGTLHVDEGEFATKVHHTHSCQECGLTWRPAVVPTVGVKFLPGFRNEKPAGIIR